MATLANLVKNIDPPVEITQEEYNNLTEEQKNDGTVYYIIDGSSSFQTAATTPAEASDGTGSNVQTELDKRLEISKLVNGGTATEAGYALDARYGKTLADQASQLTSNIQRSVSWATSGNQITTSLQDYVISMPSGKSFRWSTGTDSATVGSPTSSNSYYYDITKVNNATALIIATKMERDSLHRYVKELYGGNIWGEWVEIVSAWSAGQSISLAQTIAHCFGRTTTSGTQGFVLFCVGKPINANTVTINITNGTAYGVDFQSTISSQTATVQNFDPNTGNITFTFNLPSAKTANALILAELGLNIAFS